MFDWVTGRSCYSSSASDIFRMLHGEHHRNETSCETLFEENWNNVVDKHRIKAKGKDETRWIVKFFYIFWQQKFNSPRSSSAWRHNCRIERHCIIICLPRWLAIVIVSRRDTNVWWIRLHHLCCSHAKYLHKEEEQFTREQLLYDTKWFLSSWDAPELACEIW